jgi:two-component system sensor histidine kinase UhpB
VIGIKMAEELVPETMPNIRDRLFNIKGLAHATLQEVHTMAIRLRPSVLDDLGLSAALRSFVKEYTENTGIKVDLRLIGMSRRLPPALETVLYRVVQEALTNIARHSLADTCRVTLERHDERIMGAVSDNGCGFDPEEVMLSEEQNRGLGLHGMQERIELVEGSLKIDSRPDEGSSIYLEVPIEAKEGVW